MSARGSDSDVAPHKTLFADRKDAGKQLAAELLGRRPARGADYSDTIVLALPRGGVPLAAEIAAVLAAPLDVVVVRKLGAPGQEELALGAIAAVAPASANDTQAGIVPTGVVPTGAVPASADPDAVNLEATITTVLNEELIAALGIDRAVIERVKASEAQELLRRERKYRRGRPPLFVAERSVIVVDDGVATGATMLAALQALRQAQAANITVAVPLAPLDTSRAISAVADEFVALHVLSDLRSVGEWYTDFSQTSDEEVTALLAEH